MYQMKERPYINANLRRFSKFRPSSVFGRNDLAQSFLQDMIIENNKMNESTIVS